MDVNPTPDQDFGPRAGNGEERYVWATHDANIFEGVRVGVSNSRPDIDAHQFLEEELETLSRSTGDQCPSRPRADWPLSGLLPSREMAITRRERSLLHARVGHRLHQNLLF